MKGVTTAEPITCRVRLVITLLVGPSPANFVDCLPEIRREGQKTYVFGLMPATRRTLLRRSADYIRVDVHRACSPPLGIRAVPSVGVNTPEMAR